MPGEIKFDVEINDNAIVNPPLHDYSMVAVQLIEKNLQLNFKDGTHEFTIYASSVPACWSAGWLLPMTVSGVFLLPLAELPIKYKTLLSLSELNEIVELSNLFKWDKLILIITANLGCTCAALVSSASVLSYESNQVKAPTTEL